MKIKKILVATTVAGIFALSGCGEETVENTAPTTSPAASGTITNNAGALYNNTMDNGYGYGYNYDQYDNDNGVNQRALTTRANENTNYTRNNDDLDDMGDDMENAADKLGNNVENSVENIGQDIENTVERAGEAVEDGLGLDNDFGDNSNIQNNANYGFVAGEGERNQFRYPAENAKNNQNTNKNQDTNNNKNKNKNTVNNTKATTNNNLYNTNTTMNDMTGNTGAK